MDELSCKLNRTVYVCVRLCVRVSVCVHVFASSKGQAERLCHTPTSTQTCTSLVYHVHEIRASLRNTACSPGGGGRGVGSTQPSTVSTRTFQYRNKESVYPQRDDQDSGSGLPAKRRPR